MSLQENSQGSLDAAVCSGSQDIDASTYFQPLRSASTSRPRSIRHNTPAPSYHHSVTPLDVPRPTSSARLGRRTYRPTTLIRSSPYYCATGPVTELESPNGVSWKECVQDLQQFLADTSALFGDTGFAVLRGLWHVWVAASARNFQLHGGYQNIHLPMEPGSVPAVEFWLYLGGALKYNDRWCSHGNAVRHLKARHRVLQDTNPRTDEEQHAFRVLELIMQQTPPVVADLYPQELIDAVVKDGITLLKTKLGL